MMEIQIKILLSCSVRGCGDCTKLILATLFAIFKSRSSLITSNNLHNIRSVVKDNHEQSILFLLLLVANYSQLVGCCEALKQHRIHVQQDTDTETRQTLKK